MKKKDPREKLILKICIAVFLTVGALIVFAKFINTSKDLWITIKNAFSWFMGIISPFVTALIIAYLLNPAVALVEKLFRKLFKGHGAKAWRMISITLVYIILLGLLFLLVYFTIPQIIGNISELLDKVSEYYDKISAFVNTIGDRLNIDSGKAVQDFANEQFLKLKTWIVTLLTGTLKSITGNIGYYANKLMSFVLGLILSIYLLNEKEGVYKKSQELILAFIGEVKTKKFFDFIGEVDRVFSKFITAKLLEVISVYILSQILFIVIGVKFNVLMAVLVALTNLIPYIGPYLGGALPLIITLVDDPIKALFVLIALIGIQVADNYLISPIILGDQMGLSPFWVMFATLLFGSLFGLPGMVIAAPLAAVTDLLIKRYTLHRASKRVEADQKGEEKQKES